MPHELQLNLIPWPAVVTANHTLIQPGESISLNPSLRLTWPLHIVWAGVKTARLQAALGRLMDGLERVNRSMGRTSEECTAARQPQSEPAVVLKICCRSASEPFPGLVEEEGYKLHTTTNPRQIELVASTEWGLMTGLTTLKQLIWSSRCEPSSAVTLPLLSITDQPRSNWRGVMIDVVRHFIPVEVLHSTLEAMAFYKFNVLHLHLSDDQAFRFPSEAFPALTEVAAASGCYTRAQLEKLVEHGARLGIRLVPELDVPGHCSSWLVAYPEWGAWPDTAPETEQPASSNLAVTEFGPHQACLDPTNPAVYQALEILFSELTEIFPDPCIHIGGDEVAPQWWSQNRSVQQLMLQQGLRDLADVQNYFNIRVVKCIEQLNRTPVAWDEAMHPRLPVGVIIQSWRCAENRNKALRRGFPVVFSSGYYLDLCYPADLHYGFLPEAEQSELLLRERKLIEDPRLQRIRELNEWLLTVLKDHQTPWELPCEQWGRVLGGEACLWSELVTASILPLRLWSRAGAIAESLWLGKNWAVDNLYDRMEASWLALQHWEGISFTAARETLLGELNCSDDESLALTLLLSLLEPEKGYSRLLGDQLHKRLLGALHADESDGGARVTRSYDTDTPLNRIVDIVDPESLAARCFAQEVDELLEVWQNTSQQVCSCPVGTLLSGLAARARAWAAALPELQKLSARHPRVAEILPLAVELAHMGRNLSVLVAALESFWVTVEPELRTKILENASRYARTQMPHYQGEARTCAELTLATHLPLRQLIGVFAECPVARDNTSTHA